MMSFTILSAVIVAFAGVHLSNAWGDYIEAEFFHVGMTARAIYTAPGDGRTTISTWKMPMEVWCSTWTIDLSGVETPVQGNLGRIF